MVVRLVILGGGPAGNTTATWAARLGAEVILVERDVLGGAAHLWDCIPSKTMIATGGAMSFARRIDGMGLSQLEARLDLEAQRQRIKDIEARLHYDVERLLASQGIELIAGTGRLIDDHTVEIMEAGGGRQVHADAILLSTGTRPRIPAWVVPDGDRIITTRQAYPPLTMPEHLVVIGSGVTGVEFVHMFTSFGSKVTLVVSRQQVLPTKDPEVAAALENELLRRGVRLFKGATAWRWPATTAGWRSDPTPCWPSGRLPTPMDWVSKRPGSPSTTLVTWRSTSTASRACPTSTPPATFRESSPFRRWPPCRAERSPST